MGWIRTLSFKLKSQLVISKGLCQNPEFQPTSISELLINHHRYPTLAISKNKFISKLLLCWLESRSQDSWGQAVLLILITYYKYCFFLHYFTGYEIAITREHLTSQDILGFGGAFTDAAGINIKSLSNGTQYLLMKLENNKSFTLRPGL